MRGFELAKDTILLCITIQVKSYIRKIPECDSLLPSQISRLRIKLSSSFRFSILDRVK